MRPWLQDFTASWLEHHISYGPKEVRAQIQATYDAGYDEWLLWDASCNYDWDGLLTPQEAEEEAKQIAQSRAALPETTYAQESTRALLTVAPETGHEKLTVEPDSGQEFPEVPQEPESSRELLTVAPETEKAQPAAAPVSGGDSGSRNPQQAAGEDSGSRTAPPSSGNSPDNREVPPAAASPGPGGTVAPAEGQEPASGDAGTEGSQEIVIVPEPDLGDTPSAGPAGPPEPVEVRILD